jgi:hypothetical protein
MVIMIKLWGDVLHITCIFLQIGIIDPDCRLIGLHLYDGLFKVYSFIQLIFFLVFCMLLLAEIPNSLLN